LLSLFDRGALGDVSGVTCSLRVSLLGTSQYREESDEKRRALLTDAGLASTNKFSMCTTTGSLTRGSRRETPASARLDKKR